jgi:hypothetical protein
MAPIRPTTRLRIMSRAKSWRPEVPLPRRSFGYASLPVPEGSSQGGHPSGSRSWWHYPSGAITPSLRGEPLALVPSPATDSD